MKIPTSVKITAAALATVGATILTPLTNNVINGDLESKTGDPICLCREVGSDEPVYQFRMDKAKITKHSSPFSDIEYRITFTDTFTKKTIQLKRESHVVEGYFNDEEGQRYFCGSL